MTLIDRSGSITTGGTQQNAAAKKKGRKHLYIGNPHATEALWVNFGAVANGDSPSIQIAAGDHKAWSCPACPDGDIYVFAATTGHKYTIKEGI